MMTQSQVVLSSRAVVHHWRPAQPHASVVLQHGFAEYAERFVSEHSHLVPTLLSAGFEVWAPDLWGHGASPGRRGVTHVGRAVRDHQEVRRLAAVGDRPVLLLGHSLGGLVTAASVTQDPRDLAGVVLLSPALPPPEPHVVRRLLGAAARLAPGVPIPRPRRPTSELSRDTSVGRRVAADARMHHGGVSLLLAATALDTCAAVTAALGAWHVPTLVMHGTDDTYTEHATSRALVEAIASPDKDYRSVPGGFHELLGDCDRAATSAVVLDWLGQHAG